jgi:hypothetical protein
VQFSWVEVDSMGGDFKRVLSCAQFAEGHALNKLMPAQPTHTHTHAPTHAGPFYETTLTFLNPESGNHGATVTFDKEFLPVSEGGSINGEASYSLVYTSQGYVGGATSERAYICEPYVEMTTGGEETGGENR